MPLKPAQGPLPSPFSFWPSGGPAEGGKCLADNVRPRMEVGDRGYPFPSLPSLLILQGPPATHPSFWPSGRLAHSIREPAADNARLPTEDADRPPSPTTADYKSIPATPIRPQRTIYRSKTTLQQKAIKSIPVGDHRLRSGLATSSSADLRTGIEHNPDLRPSTGRSPRQAQ